MKYYRLHDKNSAYPDRWHLGTPISNDGQVLDSSIFFIGQPVEVTGPLRIPVIQAGPPQEFTLNPFDMPVLAMPFVEELQRVAAPDFQSVPAIIEGDGGGEYSIINILHVISCLDESRSTVVRWPANDDLPERAGTYLIVSDIHIDPTKVGPAQIFRLAGWRTAIIVSERVGAVLADATGVVLERVA